MIYDQDCSKVKMHLNTVAHDYLSNNDVKNIILYIISIFESNLNSDKVAVFIVGKPYRYTVL